MRNARTQLPTIAALGVIGGLGVFGVIAIWRGADLPMEADAGREAPGVVAGSLAGARAAAAAPTAPAAAAPSPATAPGAALSAQPTTTVFAPEEVVRAQLAKIGQRKLDELKSQQGWPSSWSDRLRDAPAEQASYELIDAVGPCERPTAAERANLTKRIAAGEPRGADSMLRFGCKERGGLVVDLTYDHKSDTIWKLIRASDGSASARLTTLLQERVRSRQEMMEWDHSVRFTTLVLADLDGDGLRDPLVTRSEHIVGSSVDDVRLSAWSSRGRRRVELGDARNGASVAVQPWTTGSPLVLRVFTHEEPEAKRYRCAVVRKDLKGALEPCAGMAAARQSDRAAEIAFGFVKGTTYPPYRRPLPDRQLLRDLLLEMGSPAAEIATITAQVAPAEPAVVVARVVERANAGLTEPRPVMMHGERLEAPRPDAREDALLKLLGDERCPAMSAAVHKQVTARLTGWVSANGHQVLRQRGDCKPGVACPWRKGTLYSIPKGCPLNATGAAGLYVVRWEHTDDERRQLVVDALLSLEGAAVTVVTAASVEGSVHECDACGPTPPQLEIEMYRRDGQAMALIAHGEPFSAPRKQEIYADGKLAPLPAPSDGGFWYRFGEGPGASSIVPSLIQTVAPSGGGLAFWHWEEGWRQIADFAMPTLHEPMPHLDAVGSMLWLQQRRVQARAVLAEFNAPTADYQDARFFAMVKSWAKPAYREELQRALVIAGADQATRDEVAALAKQP